MTRLKLHDERHRVTRVGWLRAAFLGANDGIVSTASLIVGVAAASAGRSEVLVAGVAGLVAGAMSMAAGEYVSVSSQSDTEGADLTRERGELATRPEAELEELAGLYRSRGLDAETARRTAEQLMAHDALGAHARDELGISEITTARPVQAALTSAATFTFGAAAPLLLAAVSPLAAMPAIVSAGSLAGLAILGAVGAQAGGAPPPHAARPLPLWRCSALALSPVLRPPPWPGSVATEPRPSTPRTGSGSSFSACSSGISSSDQSSPRSTIPSTSRRRISPRALFSNVIARVFSNASRSLTIPRPPSLISMPSGPRIEANPTPSSPGMRRSMPSPALSSRKRRAAAAVRQRADEWPGWRSTGRGGVGGMGGQAFRLQAS